ncbi:MAG: hypothetical protein JXQ73_06770 [Phycisphaerae bacterium]|nr:hypothetical protein [Phycisphaerae bacterium]
MTPKLLVVATIALVVAGCCAPTALEDWSSAAAALEGSWQWWIFTINIASFTGDTTGDPEHIDVLRHIAEGQGITARTLLDGVRHPVDDSALADLVSYVARARATKTGSPGGIAAGDGVLVEMETRYYVADVQAFGATPRHVSTVEYTYDGTFDGEARAIGTLVYKATPSEDAARLSQTVAEQVGGLVPLVPGLTTWENVVMRRP